MRALIVHHLLLAREREVWLAAVIGLEGFDAESGGVAAVQRIHTGDGAEVEGAFGVEVF